jgi:hypothetical protein
MARRTLALCLVAGMALPQQFAMAQSSPADVDLATGIRQVREGDFDAAVITLDGVVKRLSAQKGQAKELGRAYTYLAIAYVGLAQQETAKAKFLEAWKADKSMTLSPKEFPPNIIDFFDQARKEGEKKAEAEAKPTPTTPKPTPSPVATTDKPEKKGGGGGGKTALIVVGGLAVAGGIALAAKGGSSPPPPTLPPCTAGTDFDFAVDFGFSGAFNCGQSNSRAQTYRITNRSCSALTVQRLVLNLGITSGSCTATPSRDLSLNGTTVVPAAAGAPATAVIRTGNPAGTAHYLCCATYPCAVGSCSLNEGYTVTTSAGTKTVANSVTVIESSGRDCALCAGSVGPYSVRRTTPGGEGQPLTCGEPY